MKIGITCYPTYGGSGAVATELGLELARRGHDIHFISYASPFRLRGFAERVTFHEVVTANYPLFEQSPYALALAVKQHEVALREQLDLMHVHYAIPHATTAWLAKQMLADERDLKVLTTLHGTDITLVGQSPAEYHAATDDRGRRALAPAGNKVLVHISNFRPVKRVLDVVRIFAGVRKVLPATLIMAGDGPDRDAAEAEVDRLKLTRDVRFLGRVEDVAEVLRGADLFLLPTKSESFGLAALEAMACGVPVIATRAGGIPEVVVDGETGVLAEPGAVDAMVDAALSILKDPKRQQRMQYEALYRELLGA